MKKALVDYQEDDSPLNFQFALELPRHLKLERQSSMNDTSTYDPSQLTIVSDD